MKKIHQLKKINETKNDKDQLHRILNNMELPEGTQFTSDDSSGVVKIIISETNHANDY